MFNLNGANVSNICEISLENSWGDKMVIVNGVTYKTSKGLKIFSNGDLIIDGNVVTTISEPTITVSVAGDIDSVSTTNGDVNVSGNVGEVETTNGDVDVDGFVDGSVKTTNGNVSCGDVKGNVKTVNGNIKNYSLK